ncbi:MAG: diphthamide biosynthesis enzyme Dph2 [Methanomicrobiaceae archaeon]|nr:diphthamide biosynthesis enzyme Dph2 [Methanomicrobiaceae archaeon]
MSSIRITERVPSDNTDLAEIILSLLKKKEAEGDIQKVALQFPEGLKRKAHEISYALKKEGYDVVISGEPCWGACDLDLDLIRDSDVLVHIGHAPVDERENVIYEYFSQDFDISWLVDVIPSIKSKKVGLITTIQHVHQINDASEFLETHGIDCVIAEGSERTPFRGQVLGCSYEAARNTGCPEILYIGTGIFHPLGVHLATGARVVAFDPYTGSIEIPDERRLLLKRHALIEKAKDAGSFGIILSKKSGQRREELAGRLAVLSDKADIIEIGEITPEALLNLGYDAYVNTACPRLAYDDQARFPVPVLSPQEFEIVCGAREWEDFEIDEIR